LRPRSLIGRRLGGALAAVGLIALPWLLLARAGAQPSTPVPSATPGAAVPQTTGSPAAPATSPLPAATGPAAPTSPGQPAGEPGAPAPGETARPLPTASPTQPPIIVDPPSAGVVLGGTALLHVMQVLGSITVTLADPAVAEATVDQDARTITLTGKALGTTILTVSDARGLTRDVPIRVAYPAGTVSDAASVRLTGNPASPLFIKEQALQAAMKRAYLRPGATIVGNTDTIGFNTPLRVDDITTVDVPLIIQGEGLFSVTGTTRVRVENFAQPVIRPASLLVSDFPETLKENGVLFEADLRSSQAERFLYYHYNPPGQPDRRILLKVHNPSAEPALLQTICGSGGPGGNEMEVGHLSTQRFLVRLAQNEGSVITVAGGETATIVDQALPAGNVVSNLLQLHEIAGAPLHLALVAQNASDPADGSIPTSSQLGGDDTHARGIYKLPEFFFDYLYDAEGPDLEIPVGQIPLPNLVQGRTLAGDYGVLQSMTIRMFNYDRRHARNIAIYANPRGGRATGTFIIDRVLVQAHGMAPFGLYKLRQFSIPPFGFVRTDIVTMPEGGSSYPLHIVVAPDDGSPSPGSPDSLVY